MAVFLGESFDGCFAIDHRCDDLALFGILLGADNDVIAIAYREINHGVADDFKKEEFALSDEGIGEREDLFDVLLGKDWTTGGDTAN